MLTFPSFLVTFSDGFGRLWGRSRGRFWSIWGSILAGLAVDLGQSGGRFDRLRDRAAGLVLRTRVPSTQSAGLPRVRAFGAEFRSLGAASRF